MNCKARLHLLTHYARNISPKHGSSLNTRNNFIRRYIERVTSRNGFQEIASGVSVRGDGDVAGEGRIVSVAKISFLW